MVLMDDHMLVFSKQDRREKQVPHRLVIMSSNEKLPFQEIIISILLF